MTRKVKVNLFGAHGDRQIDITPTGFPTRHVRTGKLTETPPVCLTPNPPKPAPVIRALTAETVMTVMQAIHDKYGFKWILFDEILKVATVSFKIRTSGAPLREVLRELYRQGRIEYKTDPHTPLSKQDMFRILKTDLHQLLAEVDALLGSRNGGSQMVRTDLQCTRCARIVSEGDPDVRFKHGEVIACSACDRPPEPRSHRFQSYCACLACYKVRQMQKSETL